jgi:hypothetical protein
MLRRSGLAALVLLLLGAAVAPAQQGVLDLIPADAAAAVAIRNLDELKSKGDKLVADANLNLPVRPSQLFAEVYRFLGVQGGIDPKGAAAIILSRPENAGNLGPNDMEWLVGALPFDDLDKLAGSFGFKPGQLKPKQMAERPGERQGDRFGHFFYVRGKHLFLGNDREAVARVARGKALRGELPADRRKALDRADIVIHLNPKALGLPKDFDKGFPDVTAGLDAEEQKVVEQVVQALKEVRIVLVAVRIDNGLGVSFLTVFPEKRNEASRKILADLGGGPEPSTLRGLPDGEILVAEATSGDGSKNVLLAKVFFDFLLKSFVETREILSATNRPVYLGILTEVWQRLKGHRAALYLTRDESKLGLFSLLAILDSEDAVKFLADMRLLARIADDEDPEHKTAVKEEALDPEKLVRDLGDPRFRVRELATLKLRLLGEPALPALKKAMGSNILETARRAQRLWEQIGRVAAERRKELLAKNLPRDLRPTLTFVAKAEKLAGHRIDVVRIRLGPGEKPVVKQLQQLLGPSWDRMRLAIHGDKVVVLLGSDTELLEKALVNLKEGQPGLASAKVLAGFDRQAGPSRKVEFHVAAQRILALTTPPGEGPLPRTGPGQGVTSFALTVMPDNLQLDVWLPADELRVLWNKSGILR